MNADSLFISVGRALIGGQDGTYGEVEAGSQ